MTTALIVCAAPVPGTEALVAALAREADIVIGVDGGAGVCLRSSVVPDLVVGDLDSLDTGSVRELQSRQVPIEIYPAEKDLTDIDLALALARKRGVESVTVTGAFARRLDHTLAAIGSLLRAADMNPNIREPRMSGWLLAEGERDILRLQGAGSTMSVLALGGSAVVSCSGVKWPLDDALIEPLSSLGVSNVIVSDTAEVIVHQGVALVVSEAVDYAEQARVSP